MTKFCTNVQHLLQTTTWSG